MTAGLESCIAAIFEPGHPSLPAPTPDPDVPPITGGGTPTMASLSVSTFYIEVVRGVGTANDILRPTANGSINVWTANTGDKYAAVDEAVPDDDTTYIYVSPSDSAGDPASFYIFLSIVQTFLLPDITGAEDVVSVIYHIRAKGSARVHPYQAVHSEHFTGQVVTGSYAWYHQTFLAQPSGSAWTKATVNSSEFGVGYNSLPVYTGPIITTAAAFNNIEGVALAIALTANQSVTWSRVGGADMDEFEISGTTLRWTSNGTRDFEVPTDVNTDNIYEVTVRATSGGGGQGLVFDHTIQVTVTNNALAFDSSLIKFDSTAAKWDAT